MHGVDVGRGAVVRTRSWTRTSWSGRARRSASTRSADRARGFHVTEGGVTVIGKGGQVVVVGRAPAGPAHLRAVLSRSSALAVPLIFRWWSVRHARGGADA